MTSASITHCPNCKGELTPTTIRSNGVTVECDLCKHSICSMSKVPESIAKRLVGRMALVAESSSNIRTNVERCEVDDSNRPKPNLVDVYIGEPPADIFARPAADHNLLRELAGRWPRHNASIEPLPQCGRCCNWLVSGNVSFVRPMGDPRGLLARCSNCNITVLELPGWIVPAMVRYLNAEGTVNAVCRWDTNKGLFIAVEGPDGSGKSTFAKALVEALRTQYGVVARLECEPTNGETGRRIREMLRHPSDGQAQKLAAMFAHDRAEHLAMVIDPALARGEVVVCDRYILSSYAYQCGVDEVPYQLVHALNEGATATDVNILLRAPMEVCWNRIQARGQNARDSFERRESFDKAWRFYESFAADLNLDATQPVDEIVRLALIHKIEPMLIERKILANAEGGNHGFC